MFFNHINKSHDLNHRDGFVESQKLIQKTQHGTSIWAGWRGAPEVGRDLRNSLYIHLSCVSGYEVTRMCLRELSFDKNVL